MVKCDTPHCKEVSVIKVVGVEMCPRCWHKHCESLDKENAKLQRKI